MTISRMCFHMAWNSNIYPCRQLTSSFEYAIPSQYEKSQNTHRTSQTRNLMFGFWLSWNVRTCWMWIRLLGWQGSGVTVVGESGLQT